MPEKVIDLLDEMGMKSKKETVALPLHDNVNDGNTHSVSMGRQIANRLPNSFVEHYEVTNSVIEMLMNEGDVDSAERLFERVKNKTVITYGVMMQSTRASVCHVKNILSFSDYVKHQRFAEALSFVERIPFPLNETILIFALKACTALCDEKAKSVGKKLFDEMPTGFLDNDIVVNSTIHMLMKFGDVQGAERLFEQAKKKTNVTYGAMMQGE